MMPMIKDATKNTAKSFWFDHIFNHIANKSISFDFFPCSINNFSFILITYKINVLL